MSAILSGSPKTAVSYLGGRGHELGIDYALPVRRKHSASEPY